MHFILAGSDGVSEVTDERERSIVAADSGDYALDPALSPDGKQVAYVLQPSVTVSPGGSIDFGSDLYLVDRSGGTPRLLLKHSELGEFIRTPSWLHDGRLLVTVRGRTPDGGFDLHIVEVDARSGAQKRVASSTVDPVVSPDGRSAAYIALDDAAGTQTLAVADALSLTPHKPIAGAEQNLALISAVVWSPDGRQMAFAAVDTTQPLATPVVPGGTPGSTQHPFAQDVWLVNRDGSGLRRVTELADNMPSLGWSKDGTRIYSLGVTGFWRIEVATGDRVQLPYDGPIGQIVWLDP
jgi:Tol biopolymer transport system component